MGLNELYSSIVDDVVENVKVAFSEEGVDEQILKSLKEAWLRRIRESQQPRSTPQQQQQHHHNLPNEDQQQQNHQQQASVIVYNNNRQQQIQQQQQQQPLPPQQMRSNDNLHASTALNLSQQHRQQLVAEVSENHHLRLLQQQDKTNSNSTSHVPQLDGSNGTSDEDDNDDESDGDFPDGDDDVDVSDEEERETEANRDDEDPLNSGDDVSNDESSEMFETDNVVICQYDKITRNRNKWKFHLKDGVMNINGRDYVFQKAVGDAEW